MSIPYLILWSKVVEMLLVPSTFGKSWLAEFGVFLCRFTEYTVFVSMIKWSRNIHISDSDDQFHMVVLVEVRLLYDTDQLVRINRPGMTAYKPVTVSHIIMILPGRWAKHSELSAIGRKSFFTQVCINPSIFITVSSSRNDNLYVNSRPSTSTSSVPVGINVEVVAL